MHYPRIAIAAVLVAALAVPFSSAKAQYYYPPPCNPFPLFWPVCAAAALRRARILRPALIRSA
jgi:hypothetical protein